MKTGLFVCIITYNALRRGTKNAEQNNYVLHIKLIPNRAFTLS